MEESELVEAIARRLEMVQRWEGLNETQKDYRRVQAKEVLRMMKWSARRTIALYPVDSLPNPEWDGTWTQPVEER